MDKVQNIFGSSDPGYAEFERRYLRVMPKLAGTATTVRVWRAFRDGLIKQYPREYFDPERHPSIIIHIRDEICGPDDVAELECPLAIHGIPHMLKELGDIFTEHELFVWLVMLLCGRFYENPALPSARALLAVAMVSYMHQEEHPLSAWNREFLNSPHRISCRISKVSDQIRFDCEIDWDYKVPIQHQPQSVDLEMRLFAGGQLVSVVANTPAGTDFITRWASPEDDPFNLDDGRSVIQPLVSDFGDLIADVKKAGLTFAQLKPKG